MTEDLWVRLTPAEVTIVRAVARGLTNRAIAEELHVSVNTVKTHLKNASRKIGARSRAALAAQSALHPAADDPHE